MFIFCKNHPILFSNGCMYYYDTEVKNLIEGDVRNIRWLNANYKKTTGRFLYIRNPKNIRRFAESMKSDVSLYQAECFLAKEFKSLPKNVREAWERLTVFTVKYYVPNLGVFPAVVCDSIQ